MKIFSSIIFGFILLILITAGISNNETKKNHADSVKAFIDSIANSYVSDTSLYSGMMIGIYRPDENGSPSREIYGYGLKRKGNPAPPDSMTMYKLGSVEKTFCATIFAKLMRDSHDVVMKTKINEILPDTLLLPRWINSSNDTTYITLGELAMHYSSLPDKENNSVEPPANYTLNMFFEFLESYYDSLRHQPGTCWLYSNPGFGLLGDACSIKRNIPYAQLAQDIFSDVGMSSTKIVLTDTSNLAWGYGANGHLISHFLRPPSPALEGAGAHFSNMSDMMNFLAYNLGYLETPINNLLDTIHLMRKHIDTCNLFQQYNGQCLAWQTSFRVVKDTIVWKDGVSPDGYSSYIAFVKNSNTGVVVLMNSYSGAAKIGTEIIEFMNKQPEQTTIPEKIKLHQNYPNPFNPETKIKFDLPEPGFVKLTIYDSAGRELLVLVKDYFREGTHELRFSTGGFSSGAYFYKLETGEYVESRKMIIVR